MKQVTALEWAEALESGEYPQGQWTLLDEHGNYCCLGVYGQLAGMTKDQLQSRHQLGRDYNQAFLEMSVGEQSQYMGLNDTDEKSFPEIAAVIRQKVKEKASEEA